MSIRYKSVLFGSLAAMALPLAGVQAAQPEPTDTPTTAPEEPSQPEPSADTLGPPTLDTDQDGKADAWDRDGNGIADAWDTDGDGKPDLYDNDGDGQPDLNNRDLPPQ